MAGKPGGNVKRIFSLTLLGVVTLVVIIVANVILWRNNEGKRVRIDDLNNEVSQVYQNIAGTPQPADDLESRLAAAEAELVAAQNVLPDTVNQNDVIDYIIEVAAECRVEVVPLVGS
jgi:predicted negative regulator of RcsB-dependent stress response